MKSATAWALGAAVLFACASAGSGQETAKTGGIEGTVVNSVTGEGVRRAEVVIRSSAMQGRGGNQEGTVLTASTNAEGRYRIQNVPEGTYFVIVQKQGFVADRRSSFAPRNIRVSGGSMSSAPELKLMPQAVIAGRVVDDEGEPVQGVAVSALQQRYMNGRRRWMPSMNVQTNDLGEYRLFNLAPGRVVVAAMPSQRAMQIAGPLVATQFGGEATQYVQTLHPSAAEPDQATPLELRAGQTLTNIDIQLRRGALYRVRGRVVDPDGPGEMRFGVSAIRADDAMRGAQGASTRPDGSFEIRGLRAGSYTLIANSYDSRPVAGPRKVGLVKLDVSSDTEGAVIEMRSSFKVGGTVAVQGGTTAEKPDLKSVTVSLLPSDTVNPYGMSPRIVVGEDGTWSAEGVQPGSYRIQAFLRSQSAAGSYMASTMVGGEDYLGREIDMTAGPPGPIRIVLSQDTATLSGKVELETEGESIPVVAIPADLKLRTVDSMRMMPAGRDGSFSIRGLRPTEYLVFAFNQYQPGVLDDPDVLKKIEQKGTRIKATAGQAATVQLKTTEFPDEVAQQ